jgi:hypothetical protein
MNKGGRVEKGELKSEIGKSKLKLENRVAQAFEAAGFLAFGSTPVS